MRVTCFCSSSDKLAPIFYAEAKAVGQALGVGQYELIYGGSDLGLMGAVASGSLSVGGKVTGINTVLFDQPEHRLSGLKDLIICKDLTERKRKLIDEADVFLALPGGIGTLDEVFEVLAAKQIGEIEASLFLYNADGYWDDILVALENMFHQNMISAGLENLFTLVSTPEELVNSLILLSK